MDIKRTLKLFLSNFETYACRALLVSFILLLFVQILLREFANYTIPWGEEVATYMFVWFVFFGASYAAKMSAHNRVTFQFKLLPPKARDYLEGFADLIWVAFNLFFAYLAYDFVFNRMNLFWKSQTTGIPMKYFYMILPIAFTLMAIRILINNYNKFVLGEEIVDPESAEIEKILAEGAENNDSDGPARTKAKGEQ